MQKKDDRFSGIATNYAALWNEVVEEAGFGYQAFQRSIFEAAVLAFPDLRDRRILDLGIGDGETSKFFVEHGCRKITGVDLNSEMLEASARRFNGSVKLVQADISKLSGIFSPSDFDLVVTGATLHNIPTKVRLDVWRQIQHLDPKLFVSGDKIADDDPVRHKEYFDRETKAIVQIYSDRHGLTDMADEWIRHYDIDEQEKLFLVEIEQGLEPKYYIELIGEFGMYKTVKAVMHNQLL